MPCAPGGARVSVARLLGLGYSAYTPTPLFSGALKSPALLGPLSLRRLAALCLRGARPRPGFAAPLVAAAAASAAVSNAAAAAAAATTASCAGALAVAAAATAAAARCQWRVARRRGDLIAELSPELLPLQLTAPPCRSFRPSPTRCQQ